MYSWSVLLECIQLQHSCLENPTDRGAWPVQSMRCEPGRSQTGGNNIATEHNTKTKTTTAGLEPWLQLPT